ncbi:MAG: hypothetical protein KAS66_01335 [Candidatus Omnitrophica bacterium]|nr:hypothetical protein [Candidatus Omnitrophota bacterium]
MKIYQVGETGRLHASVVDIDKAKADPSTIKINIETLNRTAVITDTAMTKDVAGEYYYDHVCGAAGEYRYNVVAVGAGGRVTIKKSRFIINAAA